MENLWVLLRWVSWMQDTSDLFSFKELLNLSFFCRTPSAFQCMIQWRVWWLVAVLYHPQAVRRGSESQAVILVEPFWVWEPGALQTWLWLCRTTPQQSRDNCTAMLLLVHWQRIFYPCQADCVIGFWQFGCLLRVASSLRIAALPGWQVHPTRVCDLHFPWHRQFVFQDFWTPFAQLLGPAARCCPVPPSQPLGVAASPLPPDPLLGLDYLKNWASWKQDLTSSQMPTSTLYASHIRLAGKIGLWISPPKAQLCGTQLSWCFQKKGLLVFGQLLISFFHTKYDDRRYWHLHFATRLNDPCLHSKSEMYEKLRYLVFAFL